MENLKPNQYNHLTAKESETLSFASKRFVELKFIGSTLVDQILKKKSEDNSADTADLENQIDQLVYQLYDLTEEEVKIIEGN